MQRVTAYIFVLFLLLPLGQAKATSVTGGEDRSALNFPVEIDTSLARDYRTAFLLVYNQLDDLKDCDIKVKGKKLKTTMASRPTFISFFRKKDKRKYVIVYNNNPGFKGVKLYDVPEPARIGLLAHELMHVRDYQSLKFGGLVKRGWQYMSKKGKTNLEHRIDSMTVDAGFGEDLFYWSYFVLFDSNATDEYKMFKREVYLTPKDILEMMDDTGFAEHYHLDKN